MGTGESEEARFVKMLTQRPLFLLLIVFASVAGGIVSLMTTSSNQEFWTISISSHCGLIAITFWVYREKKVSLNTWAGLFDAFTLSLIASATALLLLFVLGFYVSFGLLITGRALLTSFVATTVYAFFQTLDTL